MPSFSLQYYPQDWKNLYVMPAFLLPLIRDDELLPVFIVVTPLAAIM